MVDATQEHWEEIEALEAVYPECQILSQKPITGSIKVNIESHKTEIYLKSPTGDTSLQNTIKYLPPIQLDFVLPSEYPRSCPPQIKLSCCWLSETELKSLYEKLIAIWQECEDQCLYIMISELSTVPAPDEINLSWRLFDQLVNYDKQERKRTFDQGEYKCPVCFERKSGQLSHQLSTCGCIVCLDCLHGYFEMCIRESQLSGIRCLSETCNTKAPLLEEDLVHIVGRKLYDEYLRKKKKQRLESDPNTLYCPRISCQAEAILQINNEAIKDDVKLAICTSCRFAFCRYCRMTWHGTAQPCKMTVDYDSLLDLYEKATSDERREMQVRYGPRLDNLVGYLKNERAANEWKHLYGQQCPTCFIFVERIDGCCHMICSLCLTHFCFLCGSWLDKGHPYHHFNTPLSACYQRLFASPEEKLEFAKSG